MVRIIECTQQHLDALAKTGELNLLMVLKNAGFKEIHKVTIEESDIVIRCLRFMKAERRKALEDFTRAWQSQSNPD